MKKIIIPAVAALALMATGCKGNAVQSPERQLAAQEDSLAMALGEFFAAQYAQQMTYAPADQEIDKAEYIKGMKVAFASDTTVAGKSYDQGMQMGIQLARSIEAIAKQNDLNIDKTKVLEAFKTAFAPDSIEVTQEEAYAHFISSLTKAREQKLANNEEAMANKKKTESILATVEKRPNGRKLANGLVYEIVKEGEGAKVNPSDNIHAVYTLSSGDGKTLDQSSNAQRTVPASAFAGLDEKLTEGITSMRVGSHYVFYLNAGSVPRMNGLKPYDVMKFDFQVLTEEEVQAAADAKAQKNK